MSSMIDFVTFVSIVANVLSYFGAIVIFYGGIRAIIGVIKIEVIRQKIEYNDVRLDFTPKIVIGLEFFIAADLIKTILEPNLNQVVILAVIVAIRTVVGFSLNREIRQLQRIQE